jgi:hypothetical protein
MLPIDDPRSKGSIEEPPAKRPYIAPRLVAYGDFRRLTGGRGGSGQDGGTPPQTRV